MEKIIGSSEDEEGSDVEEKNVEEAEEAEECVRCQNDNNIPSVYSNARCLGLQPVLF